MINGMQIYWMKMLDLDYKLKDKFKVSKYYCKPNTV